MSDAQDRMGRTRSQPLGRDAGHVAMYEVQADRIYAPGERLQYGIVDPFLLLPVQPGQWFDIWLYPKTVTSLRHVYSHPGLPDEMKGVPANG